MPTVWLSALRKSLLCKLRSSDSIDSKVSDRVDGIQARRLMPIPERCASLGCLSNLKDVIHQSKMRKGRRSSNTRSRVSCNQSKYPERKISNENVPQKLGSSVNTIGGCKVKGLVEHEGHNIMSQYGLKKSLPDQSRNFCGGSLQRSMCEQRPRKYHSSPPLVCQTCGEQHNHSNAAESALPRHAVSELVEGDSSRKIVEMICQTGTESNTNKRDKIERILKVHNKQNILTGFEEYREMVKTKARRSGSKNVQDPRCLADGNELLRFHGTTIACSLGMNGSSSPCKLSNCGACQILRNGFPTRKDSVVGFGIFVASTRERALKYEGGHDQYFKGKALFVCRVIAGKIHSPVRKLDQGFRFSSTFDSLAWKVGQNRTAEELSLLNPRALLPCFLVIYNI